MDDADPLSALTLYDSSSSSSSDTDAPTLRHQKLNVTEPQFQLQKSSFHPLNEASLSTTRLTLPPTSPSLTPESLKIKAEHEYYLRRYSHALSSAREALRRIEEEDKPGQTVTGRFGEAEKRELRELVGRCLGRIGAVPDAK